jgi:hypothetical protein
MGLKFSAQLTKDEIRLLDWMFRLPVMLQANGKRGDKGEPMAQYTVSTDKSRYEFEARMFRKAMRWLENSVLERGADGKPIAGDGAYPAVKAIGLNQEQVAFISTVIDFYKELCSVGILLDPYYSLWYKFHNNGVEPCQEAFGGDDDDGPPEKPEEKK